MTSFGLIQVAKQADPNLEKNLLSSFAVPMSALTWEREMHVPRILESYSEMLADP